MGEFFHDDICEQILVRLDAEDLIICKSVCKSWKSLISHPRFVKAHHRRQVNLIPYRMGIIPNYLSKYGPEYYMVGCSNMVCLRRGFQPDILMDRGLGTNGLLGLLTSSLTIDLVMSLSNGVSVTPFASDMGIWSYLQSCSSKFAHNAPGLKALLTFKLHDEDAAEGFFGDIVRVCGPQMVLKNVRDIHGLALAIVLERLNSHGAFPEVHDKTRATGSGPTVKTTSKITKSDGYGSKPESRAVSSVQQMYFRVGSMRVGAYSIGLILKCTSVIHQMAYGTAPDAFDEYLQLLNVLHENA
ncbi:protein MOR1 [Tanacetum coccineum]